MNEKVFKKQLLFTLAILLLFYSQIALGQSFIDETVELNRYLSSINCRLDKGTRYVIIYNINSCNYCNHHWIDQYVNLEKNEYKGIKFILVTDEPIYYKYIKKESLDKSYIFIDKSNTFYNYSIYSYFPILYILENEKIVDKKYLGQNSYELKVEVYKKTK